MDICIFSLLGIIVQDEPIYRHNCCSDHKFGMNALRVSDLMVAIESLWWLMSNHVNIISSSRACDVVKSWEVGMRLIRPI